MFLVYLLSNFYIKYLFIIIKTLFVNSLLLFCLKVVVYIQDNFMWKILVIGHRD